MRPRAIGLLMHVLEPSLELGVPNEFRQPRIAVAPRRIELRPGAVLRLLVGTEANEARAVTEAFSLQLVEADLAHDLRPDLEPGQVLSAGPARAGARDPPREFAG